MTFRGNSDTDKKIKYRPKVKHKAFGLDLKSSPGGLKMKFDLKLLRRRRCHRALAAQVSK